MGWFGDCCKSKPVLRDCFAADDAFSARTGSAAVC